MAAPSDACRISSDINDDEVDDEDSSTGRAGLPPMLYPYTGLNCAVPLVDDPPTSVGAKLGAVDASLDGTVEGNKLGSIVGLSEGTFDGLSDRISDGNIDGLIVGEADLLGVELGE